VSDHQPDESAARRYVNLGKYQVLALIATGGMGTVYKAWDPDAGREVALKVLRHDLTARPAAVERFRREAQHGSRLQHENLVELYEFGEADGTYFVVMEFVAGIDLQQRLDESAPLDPDEARAILIQVVRALDCAYANGIVHRDIKPSNILLTEKDGLTLAKLTDLGLAREVSDADFRLTREGCTVGTVDYMAPEQARDSNAADIRSDIYSLGCTFYHMLGGRPPFAEGGLTQRLYKHAEAEVPDVRRLNAQVPVELVGVLRRMLAKKPADRYQTPAQLLEDLIPRPRPERATVSPDSETLAAIPTLPSDDETEETAAPEQYEVVAAPVVLTTPEQEKVAAGQFERARQVLDSGNFDYGIDLLLNCCKLDPANIVYRQRLRQAQKENPAVSGWMTGLQSLLARGKLKAVKLSGNPLKVLELGEQVLTLSPTDLGAQTAMAEAAVQLGLIQLAVWLLEQAHNDHSADPALNRSLGRLYEQRGHFRRAVACWKRVLKEVPSDVEAGQKIKDLAALETLGRVRDQSVREGRGGKASSSPTVR
jgi:serine/threonine protein kinase